MTALPEEIAALGFQEARVVRLEPGDVIVLMTSKRLAEEEVDLIQERAGQFFDGHRIAVLEDGMTLEVLRKGDADG